MAVTNKKNVNMIKNTFTKIRDIEDGKIEQSLAGGKKIGEEAESDTKSIVEEAPSVEQRDLEKTPKNIEFNIDEELDDDESAQIKESNSKKIKGNKVVPHPENEDELELDEFVFECLNEDPGEYGRGTKSQMGIGTSRYLVSFMKHIAYKANGGAVSKKNSKASLARVFETEVIFYFIKSGRMKKLIRGDKVLQELYDKALKDLEIDEEDVRD